MSQLQKVLLAGSAIFFAATIYSFFYLEIYIIILLFLLHSLCLIFFCYRTYADAQKDELFMETYHQDVGLELAQKDEEINTLNDRVREKETALIEKTRENEMLMVDREKMSESIKMLEEENRTLEETVKQPAAPDINALLPPLERPDSDERETVNIIALAGQARDELMDNAKAANLHVSISSVTDTLLVKADPNRLITLFRNIIDNSIKYMKKAGSLVITVSTIGDDIFIVLKDTGEGLSEDETKHIFELNYQGSNRISGNGLGLAQARAIVEYYGGTIYAKSTEGKGMGIYIQLPA